MKKLLFNNTSRDFKSVKVSKVPRMQTQKLQEPKVEPYYFDHELLKDTLGHYSINNLYLFLAKNFGYKNAKNMLLNYNVGTAKVWRGSTVFWQIDIEGRPHDGKIMMYDSETGHRSKDQRYHVNWVHTLKNIDKNRIRQCFFGEHLIRQERNLSKKIAIVESEKTAIIASFYLPQFVWIATGGKDGMFRQADLSIFQGREVIFFPDLGMTRNWREKSIYFLRRGINAFVYDFLEQNASEEDKQAGLDIADFLLQENPLEYLLKLMKEENPAVELMVNQLELEISDDN